MTYIKGKRWHVSCYFEPPVYEFIQRFAQRKGLTIKAVVTQAVIYYVKGGWKLERDEAIEAERERVKKELAEANLMYEEIINRNRRRR